LQLWDFFFFGIAFLQKLYTFFFSFDDKKSREIILLAQPFLLGY